MTYKSSNVQKAAAENKSKYANVNKYAQQAYAQLDKYISDTKAANAAKYAQKQQTTEQAAQEKIKTYEKKKSAAKSDFVSSKSNAYADYMDRINRYGIQHNALADAEITESGYADFLSMQAATDYEQTLKEVSSLLGESLQRYDDSIKKAEADGDDKAAALLKQKNQAAQTLQNKIESMLKSISSKISSLEKQEASNTKKLSDSKTNVSETSKNTKTASSQGTSNKKTSAKKIIIRKE